MRGANAARVRHPAAGSLRHHGRQGRAGKREAEVRACEGGGQDDGVRGGGAEDVQEYAVSGRVGWGGDRQGGVGEGCGE